MRDPIGVFISVCLIIVSLAIIFFAQNLKFRGFTITVLCALAVFVHMRDRIVEFVVSYKQMTVKLSQIETQIKNIADAMETLMIAQQVQKLQADNSILLDYEPIPKSVRIIVGPLTHFPNEGYGYKLQNNKIFILNSDTLNIVNSYLPGGVTVEYIRKIFSVEGARH